MTEEIKGGGAAFPSRRDMPYKGGGAYRDDRPGMTLRDYFAAKAMQALINPMGEPLDRLSCVPEYAYEIADAMLHARQGGAQ